MDSFHSHLLWRTLTASTFEQLRVLVRETTLTDTPDAIVLTEAELASRTSSPTATFILGISPQFCALAWAEPSGEQLRVGLSFAPEVLTQFLRDRSWNARDRRRALELLNVTQAKQQGDFTLQLIQLLSDEPSPASNPSPSVCQPVEEALRYQREQERLLNQVSAQTSQSVTLAVLISNTIESVRKFLDLDRLAVYQFDNANQSLETCSISISPHDCMTYEARGSDRVPSMLSQKALAERAIEQWAFFREARDRYNRGESLIFNDITRDKKLSPNERQQLQQVGVRAQVAVPIHVRDRLWGLLIAHQCRRPRNWQPREREFLEHIAERLSVAIYQAYLYAEVQQQKETLEQRVDSRTRELRDALAAARAASQTRSDFLATISHELRTPLTCIIGMSSTLLRWSFGHLTPKQREYIQTIYNSGEHLMELINDLLDLSQIESGKTILSFSEFSLTQLAHQMFHMMVDRATVNGVHLELDLRFHPNEDRIRADRDRIRQILFNLLSNAIKFTATGGQAVLSIFRVGNSVIFEVSDTGIGIPQEQRSLLFETFRQLESTYTRQYGGTGLGLALTKQLVELHGGSIDVESQVGVGSKFTVRIPILNSTDKSPRPSSPDKATPLPPAPRKGHVVLIADREEEATLICDLLTTAGYHAIWMLEGSTALEQIEVLKPMAAIVDRRLAGMDGCELTSILRQLPNTQSLKILLMTEGGTPELLERCRASGANQCLSHPIEPEELLDTIVELLQEAELEAQLEAEIEA